MTEQHKRKRHHVRINFTLPPEAVELLDQQAKANYRSRSGELAMVLRAGYVALGILPADRPDEGAK